MIRRVALPVLAVEGRGQLQPFEGCARLRGVLAVALQRRDRFALRVDLRLPFRDQVVGTLQLILQHIAVHGALPHRRETMVSPSPVNARGRAVTTR
jgi:hypothetical protein